MSVCLCGICTCEKGVCVQNCRAAMGGMQLSDKVLVAKQRGRQHFIKYTLSMLNTLESEVALI